MFLILLYLEVQYKQQLGFITSHYMQQRLPSPASFSESVVKLLIERSRLESWIFSFLLAYKWWK